MSTAPSTPRRFIRAACRLVLMQRCKLDCTLSCRSESAEAVHDFPLEEVFRRIDLILQHHGPGTDVRVPCGEHGHLP